METREQLLEGLYYVKTQISKIISTSQRQIQLVSSFREQEAKLAEVEKIPTTGKKTKAMVIFFVFTVAFALFMALLQDWGSFTFALVSAYVIFANWNKKSVLKNVFILFWVIMLVTVFEKILKAIFWGSIPMGVLVAVLIAVSVYCVKGLIKAANKKIEHENEKIAHRNRIIDQQNVRVKEHNAQIRREYEETVETLNRLKAELYKTTAKWFPRDYYSLEAVNFFIYAIENYKCDTMKELVLLFDDSQHKKEMLASQQTLIDLNKQQILNQEKMVRHMRVANVLNIANVALNYQTLNAVRDNTAAVKKAAGFAEQVRDIIKKW